MVQSILDLDLDFFVHGAIHMPPDEDGWRPDGAEYPAWTLDETVSFLEDQCGSLWRPTTRSFPFGVRPSRRPTSRAIPCNPCRVVTQILAWGTLVIST